MSELKKILIVVGAVFLIGILLVAVPLSGRFDKIQYEKRLEMDALVAAGREDGLRAESGGIVTLVSPMNADRISRSLTPSEAKRERFVSVEDPEIVLTYANGDVVSLKADPKKEDRALVQLQYEGKKIIVSIEGYRVMLPQFRPKAFPAKTWWWKERKPHDQVLSDALCPSGSGQDQGVLCRGDRMLPECEDL